MSNSYRVKNEESLQSLIKGIRLGQGISTLIFAYCNDTARQRQLGQELRKQCPVDIKELLLESSVENLYATIADTRSEEQANALMVFGLESVKSLKKLLISANLGRENFRHSFHFPLVLWVTDEVLHQFIRVAPDFYGCSTTDYF